MFKDKLTIKGKLTVTVFGPDGKIKSISVNHNIVTDEGDAMIADLMAQSPTRNKVNDTNGRIAVGTGWTGTTPKQNTWLNSQTGSAEQFDSTYPKIKGNFGEANDNVVMYRATFEAGDLDVVGINEAVLANATTSAGDVLAYAQITPVANVSSSDTLQVDWELTFLGS
jgi:hypothetical protein